MKKVLLLSIFFLLLLLLTACGGKISKDIEINSNSPSNLYTEKEILDAIKVTEKYFKKEFSGCTLTSIAYAGDEKSLQNLDFAERIGGNEVIVLTSSFDVDESGGDGSLNPNSTYSNWMWILARKDGGKWKHVDHGY